jgi:hypothetical protein
MIMCGALLNPSPRAFVGPLGVCLAGLFGLNAPSTQPRNGEVLPVEDRQPGRPNS